MYTNLIKAGLGGFSGSWFWSSSQYNNIFAWIQSFSDGYLSSNLKSDERYSVRACRAFYNSTILFLTRLIKYDMFTNAI